MTDEENLKEERDERYAMISNFRNIGISRPEKFLLNRSREEGKLGDLVILIGPNNSGKSNILRAIESWESGYGECDIPENLVERMIPSVVIHPGVRGGREACCRRGAAVSDPAVDFPTKQHFQRH